MYVLYSNVCMHMFIAYARCFSFVSVSYKGRLKNVLWIIFSGQYVALMFHIQAIQNFL